MNILFTAIDILVINYSTISNPGNFKIPALKSSFLDCFILTSNLCEKDKIAE